MFSPDVKQIKLFLLKLNLEEIENDIVFQHSALPALDAEKEQKYREYMTALKGTRNANAKIENLKQAEVRLIAKRAQLSSQLEDTNRALEEAHEQQAELRQAFKEVEDEEEICIRQYEDTLREQADRFRKSYFFYNEEEMRSEIEKVEKAIVLFEEELEKTQNIVNELKVKCTAILPAVPDDIFTIVGKLEFEDKLKTLSEKCEDLAMKRNNLVFQTPAQAMDKKM